MGHNSDKKKIQVSYFSMSNPNMKFQNPSMHGSYDMACIKKRDTHTQTDEQPESNMPLNFFEVGCINITYSVYTYHFFMHNHCIIQWSCQRCYFYPRPERSACDWEDIIHVQEIGCHCSRIHGVKADWVSSSNVNNIITCVTRASESS